MAINFAPVAASRLFADAPLAAGPLQSKRIGATANSAFAVRARTLPPSFTTGFMG